MLDENITLNYRSYFCEIQCDMAIIKCKISGRDYLSAYDRGQAFRRLEAGKSVTTVARVR